MMPKQFDKLPLSGKLQCALDDLLAIKKDPAYEIEMGSWHEPSGDKCLVCHAGAVMARTLRAAKTSSRVPGNFTAAREQFLYAVDKIRNLRLQTAARSLELSPDYFNAFKWHKFHSYEEIPHTKEDWAGYIKYWKAIIRYVKAKEAQHGT